MTAPKSRARRRPCKVCGESERNHGGRWLDIEQVFGRQLKVCVGRHRYEPIDPTPHGVHRTTRLDLKIPDPDNHGPRWRALAEVEGTSLGDLCRRALDAYAAKRPDYSTTPGRNRRSDLK